MAGAKSVLFVTGLCSEGCYYCPISPQRKGRDVMFINEVPASGVKDIVEEVASSMSEGVGVTGGEPMLVLERVVAAVRGLKESFGNGFHVHLYTSGAKVSRNSLERLVDAGLDELRVHVVSKLSLEVVRAALEFPIDVVVENPAIPGSLGWLVGLVAELDRMGVRYVNLNELEVSELNAESLAMRGFRVSRDGRSVVGSKEVALAVLKRVEEEGLGISVHYCPAIYKDAHQYPKRLNRRAIATRRVFEEVGEGLVKWVELGRSEVVERLFLADMAVRLGETYAVHPKIGRGLGRGKVVEALPLSPRKVLNEYGVDEA
jgi:pyruvate formate-lyase activating enzyme-like uncharacterized protein